MTTVYIPMTSGCYSPDYPTAPIAFDSEAKARYFLELAGKREPEVWAIDIVDDPNEAWADYKKWMAA